MIYLKTLADFTTISAGDAPTGLIMDSGGDLLGTTGLGGVNEDGDMYRIANTSGTYAAAPTILTNFNTTTGDFPGPLVADSNGNLFGTTPYNGVDSDGAIFEIRFTNGTYAASPTILSSFDATDGKSPFSSLIFDAQGDLFGTTLDGGAFGYGAVIELALVDGVYSNTPVVLASFDKTDGASPQGSLLMDGAGNLFGTAGSGGAFGYSNYGSGDGTVFEIPKVGAGYASTPTVLANFNGSDGAFPTGGLIADAAGDLFGTTTSGGPFVQGANQGDGTVFELVDSSGTYASTPTTLADFNGTDGDDPEEGLVADAAGDLFGTTGSGGLYDSGAVFEVADIGGAYANTPIPVVSFNGGDGDGPSSGLIADTAGNLYGTTDGGGNQLDSFGNSWGSVFEVGGAGFRLSPDSVADPLIINTISGQSATDHQTIHPFAKASVADPNPGQTENVSVALSDPGNGILSNLGGGSYNASTGVYTYQGTAVAASTALDGLIFTPTVHQVALGQTVTTTFTITDTDTGGATGTDSATTVTATAVPNFTTLPVDFLDSNLVNPLFDGGNLIIDPAGNLFGTAFDYNTDGGDIFEIVRTANGYAGTPITVATLPLIGEVDYYSIKGLVSDSAGDLFGTVAYEGTTAGGDAFEITKTATGYASTPTILTSLTGANPSGLIIDSAGDLFGTNSSRSVFEISKTASGYASTPTTLASFSSADGVPGGLTMDANGDLFGTTPNGGVNNEGMVFEIVRTATGYLSTPATLSSFNDFGAVGSREAYPTSGVVMDAAGDLFGTAASGGSSVGANDTLFEVAKTAAGYASTPALLATVDQPGGSYGEISSLLVDGAGNVFGTTDHGGTNSLGSVFELLNTATGYASTPNTLYSFTTAPSGSSPTTGLTADAVGNLFGARPVDGDTTDGSLFEMTDSGFAGAVTEQGSTITAAPQNGQTVSLNQVAANQSIVPTGTIQSLLIDGPGTTTADGTVSINDLEVSGGQFALSGATVNTDPYTVDAQGDIIGYGTVTGAATNLGTITASGGTLELTESVTGIGTLIAVPNATLQLDLGGAAGAAKINGGALASDGEFDAGQSGLGGILIEAAGTVITGISAIAGAQGLDIAKAAGGSGDVVVTGAGSSLSNTGEFVVGDAGAGSLAIQSGGTVVTNPGTAAGAAGLVIGNTPSATGSSVNVTGAGSGLHVTGLLDVGAAGSGALSVNGGATVTAGSLDAANIASAVGDVTVTDPGTSITLSGAAVVADDGTGVLSVLNGATFAASNLTIGAQTDSSGAMVVSGTGSTVNITGALNIGTALGTGDVTVGPGAAIHAGVINQFGQVVDEGGLLDPTVLLDEGTDGGTGTIASDFIIDEGTIAANSKKAANGVEVVSGTVVGGGTLTISGGTTLDGTTQNSPGLLLLDNIGTLEVQGPVLNAADTTFIDNGTPTGSVTVFGTYDVANSVVDVTFLKANEVLILDDISGFAGTVTTTFSGDKFVITGGTLSNLGVSNGDTLTISDTGQGVGGTDRIMFSGPVSTAGFNIVNGNTLQVVACFAEGTRIATPDGLVAVEDLCVGDRAVTSDGGASRSFGLGNGR